MNFENWCSRAKELKDVLFSIFSNFGDQKFFSEEKLVPNNLLKVLQF